MADAVFHPILVRIPFVKVFPLHVLPDTAPKKLKPIAEYFLMNLKDYQISEYLKLSEIYLLYLKHIKYSIKILDIDSLFLFQIKYIQISDRNKQRYLNGINTTKYTTPVSSFMPYKYVR